MLRKAAIHHMLEAAHVITKCKDFVIVGSGALIATRNDLPGTLMMTPEIDLYARDAKDPEDTASLIEATLGSASWFFKTYNYYADAVSSETATMPTDWTDRAKAPTCKIAFNNDPTARVC